MQSSLCQMGSDHPVFIPTINGILRDGIPPSWKYASISLIKKKKKDSKPLDCSRFRPISLLNVDYQIVAKILARRLENFLLKIINPDQAGFVKSRYGTDNLQHALDVVHYI